MNCSSPVWIALASRPGRAVRCVLVDATDAEVLLAYSWHLSVKKYAATQSREHGRHYMHRLLMAPEPGLQVDHVNGDTFDNRRANLRVVSRKQNQQNTRPIRMRTGGFKGVSFDRRTGRWIAKCIRRWGGRHDTAEAAARVYDRLAKEEFGEFAALNFPAEQP